MNKYLKSLFYIILILIPSVFVFASFVKPLHLTWGDAPYLYPESLKELVSGLSTWSQKGIDFGGRNLALWLSPIMALYGSINRYFGLNNDAIIRIVFYFPAVIFAALGPYFLTKYLKFSDKIQFFSSFLYLFNTYFLMLIDGGQVGVVLAYGIFPFVILFWKKFLDNLSVNGFFIALLTILILCYIDPRVLILSFVFIFLWQILEVVTEKKLSHVKNLLWLILAGALVVPVNAFWLLPLVKGGIGSLSTSVTELQLSSLLNSLFLFAPHWPSNVFGKVTPPYFYFSLVPVLVFGGFLFRKIDKRYYIFSLIFLFFAFIAKGSTPPLGNWYEFFISRVPFGSVFRDSSKFFIPMLLMAGILIGNTVDTLSSLWKGKVFKAFVFGATYLYLILLVFPALMGKLNFNLSSRKETADYQIIYEHLKNESGNFRTLWFNEKSQIAFETTDKPALSANQITSFRPFASINEGEDVYNFLNNPDFVDWLRAFGVRYIFLSGDPRNIYPTERDTKNWLEINNLVSQAPGLTKLNWDTKIPVFRIENSRPESYSVKRAVLVVGPDLELAGRIPAAVYAEDGKFDPKVLEKIIPDSLIIVMNKGNSTDLTMSFLQRYFKSAKDASKSEWATFGSNQYLKYKYELLIRDFKFRDFDFGRGVAFSTKRDEKIGFIFDIPADGNYVIAKRVGTLQKQKLVWNLEQKTLKAGKFEYNIENTSGLEVLNTVAVIPESIFNDSVKLSGIYISTFGTISDLGPSVSDWHEAVVKSVNGLDYKYKIKEGDHWLIYTQNFDSNWVSDTSDVHIPVFSMINGFYLGNANQATIEFAGQKYLSLGAKLSLGSILVLLVSYLAYAIHRRAK